ncbi:MAG: YdcF family protein [Pirellulaceae bacterium]|nr:YdcF family protein [Pirellulaceae bacterium]
MNVVSNAHSSRSTRPIWMTLLRFIVSWSIFPVVVVGVVFAMEGRTIAEKAATMLIMPVSIAWWGSFVLAIKCLIEGNGRIATWVFGFSMVIYLASSPIVAKSLMGSLESSVQPFSLDSSERLDTIIVLGGGTTQSPSGQPQFASAGDRVGFAARMYHQKLVDRIVVTGDGLVAEDGPTRNDPSIQAKQILKELDVPDTIVEELPGINTSQEMIALKSRPELWEGKRCGLVTSAFHMPRALRLARKNGIDLVPIPVDYRAVDQPVTLLDWFPAATYAQQNDLACKEYLGMLLGR